MFEKIKRFFCWLLGKFKKLIQAAYPIAKQMIILALKDIAYNAILELSHTDLSNEDKRNEAIRRIKQYAIARGITEKDHLIESAFCFAFSKFKTEQER